MSRKLSRAMRNGWITDQHGSWAMGFAPLIYGLGLAWPIFLPHFIMACAWTCGFFFFAVAEKWLKFSFRPRYRPALVTYGLLSGIFCLILVLLKPHLLWWAVVYLPLIALSFRQSWAHRERQLISRLVDIAAATLVLAVVVNISVAKPWFFGGVTPKAWLFSGLLATYFAATVPFVKTLIRERKSLPWLLGSIVTHVVIVLAMVLLAIWHWTTWWQVAVWVVLLFRAVAMPVLAKQRGRPWLPKQVGLFEIFFSVLVFITMPYGFQP